MTSKINYIINDNMNNMQSCKSIAATKSGVNDKLIADVTTQQNNTSPSKTIMNIHDKIINKLYMFHKNKSIPNIIFHGPTGSGKRSILNNFINTIYNNDCNLKKNPCYVC